MTESVPGESAMLQQVVEVSADAIFVEDTARRITSWNPAAERLYGVTAAQMIGRSTADLLPDQTVEHLEQVRRLAVSGQRVERFDTWHLRPDGRHIAVSVTVSPLRGATGEVVGLVTSVQDVTERVALAAELEDAHRTLQERNAALTRSNRDLQQFAYVASHDLSEPLRVMTGYVQLLEKRYADALDERASRWIGYVVDGSTRMRALIDDLLEYSRFLQIDRSAECVDVEQMARSLAQRAQADVPGAVVEVGAVPRVVADPTSVESVLANLVANAVKFARPGQSPHVVVHGERAGAQVTLMVDDDGIGIPPQYRERIFLMFQRLHHREDYAGTGIGLAIVQQVAQFHGGRAWAGDSPSGGTRMCVTLPAAPEEAA